MASKPRKDLLKEGTGLTCGAMWVSLITTVVIWLIFPRLMQYVLAPFSEQLGESAQYANLILTNCAIVVFILLNSLCFSRKVPFKEKAGFSFSEKYSFEKFAFWGIVDIAVVFGIVWLTHYLFELVGIPVESQTAVETAKNIQSVTGLTVIGFSAVIFAPIAEEYAFRHVLYRCFRWKLLRREAILLVAFLFALAHINIVPLHTFFKMETIDRSVFLEMLGAINLMQMIPLFFFGLFLQRMYEKSHSVLPCIATHSIFNLINFSLLLYARYMDPSIL